MILDCCNIFTVCAAAQIAGAYFTVYLRAVDYCLLEDPCPSPRSTLGYFLAIARDIYLPFESRSGAGLSSVQSKHISSASRPDLERQPLAQPSDSFTTAAARLIRQLILQYILYDFLLTVCVKPLGEAVAAVSGPLSLPIFSIASLQASMAFTACLYLHFAMMYKSGVLALTLVQPVLLYRCRHLFREPWRGLLSTSELWQRWHQLFRLTFMRLAYRPAKDGVRRLLGIHIFRSTTGGSKENESNSCLPEGKLCTVDVSCRAGGSSVRSGSVIIEDAVPLMAVFFLSGIIHEYMCWAAFGVAQGWQLGFFLAHGAMILLEQLVAGAIKRGLTVGGNATAGSVLVPVLFGLVRAACAVFCVLSSAAFMRPWIEAGYHRDFWHPVSPVAWALRWLAAYGADAK